MSSVREAVSALQAGQMVILSDAEARENEGDVVVPAQHMTAEQMAFLMREVLGTICVALDEDHFERLAIPMSPRHNTMPLQAPFGLCVDAARGITTGISAADRLATVKVLADPSAGPNDLQYPGHVFTLRAHPEGLIARQGHTEGAIALMRLAGLQPVCVLSELCNADGSVSNPEQVHVFSKHHHIPLCKMDAVCQELG